MTQLEKQVRIYNIDKANSNGKMFEEQSGILNWNDIYNNSYYDFMKQLRQAFWIPSEVSVAKDVSDWKNKMTDQEKQVFKRGVGILASLDSVAEVYDYHASQYIKDPSIKALMSMIAYNEITHNESYSYVLSSIVPDSEAREIFNYPKEDKFMIERNKRIMEELNSFIENPTVTNFVKAQVANAILEGVSFTNGFTPFYYFARNGKMFGMSEIIEYIQKEEQIHSMVQGTIVRDVLTQYPEYNTEELTEWIYDFVKEIVLHEQEYCKDLYKEVDDIDMYEVIKFIEYRANIMLDNLGLSKIFDTKKNPMPWINAFDPQNRNRKKEDFFEKREKNYELTSGDNGWDDL
ncbi:ribonucleotide reductase of class Ia (aerobic) beta subunit [Staphylococcus phage PT94]